MNETDKRDEVNAYLKSVEPYLEYTVNDFRSMDKRSRKHAKKMLNFYLKDVDFEYRSNKVDKATRDRYMRLIANSIERLDSSYKGKMRRIAEFFVKAEVGYVVIYNTIKYGEEFFKKIARRWENGQLNNKQIASFVMAGWLATENWGKKLRKWF